MVDTYKNIEHYNPNKKQKILIVFDNMIDDMLNNKNHNTIVAEFFITGRKLNISRCHANFYALFNYDNSK